MGLYVGDTRVAPVVVRDRFIYIYNESITQVNSNGVLFKFYINSAPEILTAQVEYADNQQLQNSTIVNVPIPVVGENSVRIVNLLPQTTYWFKATATNQYGSAESPTLQQYSSGTIEWWIKGNPNLMLWLTPGNVLLDSSNKVQRWYDLSPNNYTIQQTTASARPSVNNNGINGYQTLVFNGTSTYLTGENILNLMTNSWTWFAVFKSNNLSEHNKIIYGKTYYGSANWRYWVSGSRTIVIGLNHDSYANYYTNQLGKYYLSTFLINRSVNGNNYLSYNNNILVGTCTLPSDTSTWTNTCRFLIGAFDNAQKTAPQTNYVLDGEIAEIIAFNSNDPSIRTYVTQYLTNKYFPNAYLTVDLGDDVTAPSGTSSYVIDAGAGFESYLWSTGETTQTITVTQSGTYSVTCTTDFGVESSDSIDVTFLS